MRRLFILLSIIFILLILIGGFFASKIWWAYAVVLPLIALGVYNMLQNRHTILRNFPLLGYFRYFFEMISPEIQQYFIERQTDGTPISRNHRSLVYRRAKDVAATHPFGTELDLYNKRYEGLKHSIYAKPPLESAPRVRIGGAQCQQPYEASLYNISAMSFGALSRNAVLAMNKGAAEGGFYHNTGEGGLSEYHLQGGGDLVWQIGTGYFGCRTQEGRFNPQAYQRRATHPNVKMIELKLSQGAKPGHGGVLPAVKNSEEIAHIRMVTPHTEVLSPPGHNSFDDAEGLLRFIAQLRDLSGGKPTGFKLCIGREDEFIELCDVMQRIDIRPDFITVDGAEGGTGAAPLEYTDSVGMPLEPALTFVHKTLEERGLLPEIKVIASGKIITAAQLIKMLSLGANLCNSARAFMLAVGCIQAQRCDTNNCPTGVTTQRPELVKGLVVEEKYKRVANFHRHTILAVQEMIASCGASQLDQLQPELFMHGYQWPAEGGTRAG